MECDGGGMREVECEGGGMREVECGEEREYGLDVG